jgi:hypothetical protein
MSSDCLKSDLCMVSLRVEMSGAPAILLPPRALRGRHVVTPSRGYCVLPVCLRSRRFRGFRLELAAP